VTRALVGVLALLATTVLAGCAPSTVDTAEPSHAPAGTCLPPPPSGPAAAPSGAVVQRVPDLALECFHGGGAVRLADLHRPVIVNLWASWCTPCRAELPAFQRFATAAGDRVTVLGVDTGDTRTAGGALLSDLKVSYPTLYDDQRRLLTSVGRTALPVTLFVDADGGIRYVYNSTPLDDAGIAGLARTYLGVG
jgi:thiol-disulfide isomerase/thioredoxin